MTVPGELLVSNHSLPTQLHAFRTGGGVKEKERGFDAKIAATKHLAVLKVHKIWRERNNRVFLFASIWKKPRG